MSLSLGQKNSLGSLLRFSAPTVCMMVCLSFYTIVDGIFVSRFVGMNALSAINIILPVYCLICGVAIMFATGGSAIVAKKLGEKRQKETRADFTLIIIAALIAGCAIALLGTIFLKPLNHMLGASDILMPYCNDYGFIIILFAPVTIFKLLCDYLLVTAGKPQLGLINAILGGVTNIVLDYFFLAVLDTGIGGAAVATIIGQFIPCIIGIVFFSQKKHDLHFTRPSRHFKLLGKACFNGASELVTSLSEAITITIFNLLMLKYLGEEGVAAITIVLYAQYLIIAVFMGFGSGIAPIISFQYGAQNSGELRKIIGYSYGLVVFFSLFLFVLSRIIGADIVAVFSNRGTSVFNITLGGFEIFAWSFIFVGVNIFSSAMFTAFSNGKVSAIISFCKNLGFLLTSILLLSTFYGIDGIWASVPVAELLSFFVSAYFVIKYRKVYGYGKRA